MAGEKGGRENVAASGEIAEVGEVADLQKAERPGQPRSRDALVARVMAAHDRSVVAP